MHILQFCSFEKKIIYAMKKVNLHNTMKILRTLGAKVVIDNFMQ